MARSHQNDLTLARSIGGQMATTSPEHRKLVRYRWGSLIACGLVAAAIVLLFDTLLYRLTDSLVVSLSHLGTLVLLVGITVPVLSICALEGWARPAAFLGLRHFRSYPPLWVAILVGLACWSTLHIAAGRLSPADSIRHELDDSAHLALIIAAALFAGLLIAIIAQPLLFNRTRDAHASIDDTPQSATPLRERSFEELCDWLNTDDPINDQNDDLFGSAAIARRIASRLREAQNGEAPTMALIGPQGSGKSSVRNLVENALLGDPNICFVHLSLWPYDSAEAAVRGILDAAISGLARHVNVLALRGLSDAYAAAIESTSGSLSALARFLRADASPEQVVARFSQIARTAGIRMVLWIEDLERFSGGGQLSESDREIREAERLGPVRALLYLIDQAKSVTVVLADTSLRTRFDLSKIARFVERMPAVERETVTEIVQFIRSTCLDGYPKHIDNPAKPRPTDDLGDASPRVGIRRYLEEHSNKQSDLRDALAIVLDNPRAFKQCLRLALATWKRMPGEVELDSVIVASALRTAYPDILQEIDTHIAAFRGGLVDRVGIGGDKGRVHPAIKRIKAVLSRDSDHRKSGAVERLVLFLFPAFSLDERAGERDYLRRPQALCEDRHADYWRRYLTSECVPEHVSDQAALRSICGWLEGGQSDLVQRITDPNRSAQIQSFVRLFKRRDLLRLLSEVVDELELQSASDWEDGVDAPGIVSLWLMLATKPTESGDVYQTLLGLVQRTSASNLPLAHALSFYLTARGETVKSLMSDEHANEINAALGRSLALHFVGPGSTERLRVALRNGSPWIVWWVAFGMPRVRQGDTAGAPFDGWEKFSRTLLDLAEESPDVGLPVVVPFLVASGPERRRVMWVPDEDEDDHAPHLSINSEFQEALARALFDFPRLVRLLAAWSPPSHLHPHALAHCNEAVQAAQRIVEGQRPKR